MKPNNFKRSQSLRLPRADDSAKHSVIDFSDDMDGEPDSRGDYTMASLSKPDMPRDFTICSAFIFQSWADGPSYTLLFELLDYGYRWGSFKIYAADTYTEFTVWLGEVHILTTTDRVMFPLTWKRVCVSLDTVSGKVGLVVDGQVVKEKKHQDAIEEDVRRPTNMSLVFGYYDVSGSEFTGMTSNMNIFSSPLSTGTLIALTEAGGEECGAPGDYVSWEEEDWQLYSKARLEMIDALDGPCMGNSEVTVYTADFPYHSIATNIGKHSSVTTEAELSGCMEHCQKLGNGRSPPMRTQEEWDWLFKEVNAITSPDIRVLKDFIWLAASDEEVEGEWRDAYPPYDLLNSTEHLDQHIPNTVNKNCVQWYMDLNVLLKHWCSAKSADGDTRPACLKGVIKIKA